MKQQPCLLSGAFRGRDSEFPVCIRATAQPSGSEWPNSTGRLGRCLGAAWEPQEGSRARQGPEGKGGDGGGAGWGLGPACTTTPTRKRPGLLIGRASPVPSGSRGKVDPYVLVSLEKGD